MHGVRLVIAYDGTDFVGWQRQLNGRSVQEVLSHAAAPLAGGPVTMRGASRTDSGVHAHGQVVGFDSPRLIPPHGWVRGLNGGLPQDVAVVSATPCEVGFDPRYRAAGKTYRYLVHLGVERDPLLRHRAWHLGPRRAKPRPGGVGPLVDLEAMREAACHLIGEHDFRAFRSAGDVRLNTVRELMDVRLIVGFGGHPQLLAVEVHGKAFLQHMVRIIVGTLVDVGRERLRASDIVGLLGEASTRARAGETAPAHGLYLVEVELREDSPG